ncbi:FAD-dependent oxidoreductase [Chloroflexota bacterium]
MDVKTKEIDTDVLVIGSGAAGLWAAIRARDFCPRVTVVDKGKVGRSGATAHTHCILAPVAEEILYPAMKEIVVHAAYLCDQEWIASMLTQHGARLGEMEGWGVPFERESSGKLHVAKDRKQVVNSSVYVLGSIMMDKMKEHAQNKGVDFVERVMAVDLLTSDGQYPTEGRVAGAVGLHPRTGEMYLIRAKAVIITTGTISGKLHTNYLDNITGDGQAMAFRAGAELSTLEFGFTPSFPIWERKIWGGHPAVFQLYGARLVNREGETFMEKYFPGQTLQMSSMVDIGQAIAKEALEGRGPIYFDLSSWTDETVAMLRRILPSMMKKFDEVGIDLGKQRLETMPLIARWGGGGLGGIRINTTGESAVSGLYAAGVSAHVPIDSGGMTGVPQAMCFFSGYTAGENAGRTALEVGDTNPQSSQVEALKQAIFSPLGRGRGPTPRDIYLAVNKVTIPAEYSFIKSEERIKATLAEVKRVQEELPMVKASDTHELVMAHEARNFALMAEAVYRCALERKESRLSHYRQDFPYRDDLDWLKWTVLKRGKTGIEASFEPIPIEEYPIKPAERLRIPAPIQFDWEGGKTN